MFNIVDKEEKCCVINFFQYRSTSGWTACLVDETGTRLKSNESVDDIINFVKEKCLPIAEENAKYAVLRSDNYESITHTESWKDKVADTLSAHKNKFKSCVVNYMYEGESFFVLRFKTKAQAKKLLRNKVLGDISILDRCDKDIVIQEAVA